MASIDHPYRPARRQRGSFLLEALIAVLIVALGILGLVGLQARAIQNTDDAQYRSEAAFLANDLLGQMWISDQATLVAEFATNATATTSYGQFKTLVGARLPGATATDPTVTVVPRFGDPAQGYDVVITVFWKTPGQSALEPAHRYQTSATVKVN